MISSCVRSGFCCKTAPCGFGEVTSATNPRCKFLEEDKELAPGVTQYRCGKYVEITSLPVGEWYASPAFGAGCCMPLFNEDRNKILKEMISKSPRKVV